MRTPKTDAAATQRAKEALSGSLEGELLNQSPETVTANAEVVGAEDVVPQTTGALTVRGNNAVVKGAFYSISGGTLEGEFDQSDIRHPQLKIVNGSGPLSQTFNQGTIILGDEELLPAPHLDPAKVHLNPVLRVVPVQLKKQFREKLSQEDYAAGLMPRVLHTLAEVEAVGGTTQWIGKEQPSWQPMAICLILIQRPDEGKPGHDHPLFAIELDGKVYAPAVFYAAGGGYNFPKAVISLQSSLFEGVGKDRKMLLPKYNWSFKAVKKTVGNFSVFQPEVRCLSREVTGPELREFAANLVTTPEAAESGD